MARKILSLNCPQEMPGLDTGSNAARKPFVSAPCPAHPTSAARFLSHFFCLYRIYPSTALYTSSVITSAYTV